MADEEETAASFDLNQILRNGSEDEEFRLTVTGEPIDIEEYAARYTYRTKINRLRLIADRCPALELKALKMAYDEIKSTGDTKSFKEVVAKINGRLGEAYGPDDDWVDSVERQAEEREKKLKSDLDEYKKTLSNASIWNGYDELGHFYYVHGNLGQALATHNSKKDYCSTAKQTVDTYLDVILISIEKSIFPLVSTHAIKGLGHFVLDPKTNSKLRCAAALAYMDNRLYKLAARMFLTSSPTIGNSYSEVIAPRDIATYGVLCALATFDHQEIKDAIICNLNFRGFLEFAPDVKNFIFAFFLSNFDFCLNYLADLKPTLLLDIYLHEHVEDLYARIRKRAMIQYTLPFTAIHLQDMANLFRTTVGGLEEELAALIADNLIWAHLDTLVKVLYVSEDNLKLKRDLQTVKELQSFADRMAEMYSCVFCVKKIHASILKSW